MQDLTPSSRPQAARQRVAIAMSVRAFVACLLIALTFPYAITKAIPENIREARLLEAAPRQTVTVSSKWTKRINPKTDGYWIGFQEPVANTSEVQITSAEWKSLPVGGQITIAVLPDGRPHSLNSGASVAFEQAMLVLAVVSWLAATAYVLSVALRWVHGRDDGSLTPR